MHRQARRASLTLAAVCLIDVVASGRQVFRTNIEYVRLDVVVTDKQDRPVEGLKQSDFLISESGRTQSLATFEAVSTPTVRREVTDARTTTPSIDVVSNSAPPLGRQWVMVVDDLHIIESQERKLRSMVTEFLQRIPPEDQVAIVFVGRSDLSQGFTSDLGAQLRTVNRLRDALGQAYDAANNNGMPDSISGPGGSGSGGGSPKSRTLPSRDVGDAAGSTIDSNQSGRHRFAQATTDVLNNVSRALANSTYPRKAIVYVSEGATYDLNQTFSNNEYDMNREAEFARDYFDEMGKAFAIARHAGVPVYAIDPRGLTDGTAVRGMAPAAPVPGIQYQANNMRAIAENTGGLAFVGMSDVPRAVEALIHDNDVYYLLGFYPEPFTRDGQFHDVAVKVKDHPEYRVRARAGYTAPAAVPAAPVDLAAQFNAAMVAALPESGIGLRVFAAPIAPAGSGMKTAVTLQVTYPAEAGKVSDTLDYAITALDGDGKVKLSARKSFEFTATASQSGDATFTINDVIDVPSQPLALRVGVASHRLGKVGVIHTAVEAPRVGKDDATMGGVVLGYAGSAREDAKPKGIFNGVLPFQPTTDRTFTSSDTLRIFAPVFWKGSAAATITLAIRDGANAARALVERHDLINPEASEAAVTTRAVGGSSNNDSRASFAIALPLKGVPAGNYILAITVTGTGHPAKREVAFSVK